MSDLGNKEVFSKNLKRYLYENDKTVAEMCRDIDMKYTTVIDWVNGKNYPRPDKVERVAKYFGVRTTDLIEKHGSEDSYMNFEELQKINDSLRKSAAYKRLMQYASQLNDEDVNVLLSMAERMIDK